MSKLVVFLNFIDFVVSRSDIVFDAFFVSFFFSFLVYKIVLLEFGVS